MISARPAHVGEAGQEFLEHDAHLQAGQGVAEAEMGAALAEEDVVVRGAGDVEAVGVGEYGLVAVPGGEPEDDLVALVEGRRPSGSG
ncbi:hypothetical protein [Actinomadura darangshiensis]|uniref:hypothetical protein n=1 Tax=Actinomadura darangshiensis TaxID=705336 RepID=UPI001A9E06B6|nr:hypothetical protein [Actinomadura darangshiensis]